MRVLVAESFLASVARLQGRSAADVKRAAFDFLATPDHPGLRLHRLVHAVDRGFWSLRAGRDLRVIVHRAGPDAVLCYADHHDEAYAWAADRVWAGACPRSTAAELEVLPPARSPSPPPRAEERAGCEVRGAAPPPPGPGRASPRRQRMRRRALAPFAGGAALPAAGRSAPPPLVELLRFVRGARGDPGAPRVGPAPAVTPGAPSKAPRRHARAGLVALALLAVAAFAVPIDPGPATGAPAALGAALAAALLLLLLWTSRRRRAAARALGELVRVTRQLRAGRLEVRPDPARVEAVLRPLVEQAGAAVEAAVAPAFALGAAVTALARGERPALDGLPEALSECRVALEALAAFLVLEPGDIRLLVDRR